MTDDERTLQVERYRIMSIRQLRNEWQRAHIGSVAFELISAELRSRNHRPPEHQDAGEPL